MIFHLNVQFLIFYVHGNWYKFNYINYSDIITTFYIKNISIRKFHDLKVQDFEFLVDQVKRAWGNFHQLEGG